MCALRDFPGSTYTPQAADEAARHRACPDSGPHQAFAYRALTGRERISFRPGERATATASGQSIMRILAAGWHGQIARAFMQTAPVRNDISAFAIGRPRLDICDPRSIERALGDIQPDILINLAGYTDVDGAESEPELAFALNSVGARLLAEAAARRHVPIVHISTSYVFDGHKASAYAETDAAQPSTVYGKSRLAGELAVQAANRKHVILRTGYFQLLRPLLRQQHSSAGAVGPAAEGRQRPIRQSDVCAAPR